jgi:hypothetical protein
MGIEEFEDVLNQTITVEPFTGSDGYGEPSFGTSISYKARCVGKTRIIRDGKGNERISSHTVYVNSLAEFSPKDRITLPIGYSPQQPQIISIGSFPDESGMHHKTIYLE